MKQIKVMGHIYGIEYIEHYAEKNNNGDLANANFHQHIIKIDSSTKNTDELLLHEILHIISYHLGLQLKEETIWPLSECFFQIFKDNPEFLETFKEHLLVTINASDAVRRLKGENLNE